ncbi:MAG: FAD-binding oxidoreductase [Alphaproteobacteria bacterium]|nr:FAD-binding oxidoreductase [Alphaproteobacteria bacterium]
MVGRASKGLDAPIALQGYDCDIAVVGAGVIGTTTALELQAAGYDVMLIDRKGVAAECSFGNAGHLAVEHIFPLSSPATIAQVPRMLLAPNGPLSIRWQYLPKLMPWLLKFLWAGRPAQVARGTKAISALNEQALTAYRSLDARFGLDGLLHEDGTLVVYESDKGIEGAHKEQGALAEFGVETEFLESTALKDFDPALNPALKGALRFPGSAHVGDPARLVRKLASHFVRLGGRIERQEVRTIEAEISRTILATNTGRVRTRALVVASGAWSHHLARQLGYKAPLETERGYHLMLSEPTRSPRVPTTFAERRFVATPMEQGLRLAGRVELGGLQLPARDAQANALMPLGRDLLPGLDAAETSPWMGFRPTLPDSLPVIGEAPNHRNIYFAFGHNHMGLTHGAITAQLIRELIKGETPSVDLTPYWIGRF